MYLIARDLRSERTVRLGSEGESGARSPAYSPPFPSGAVATSVGDAMITFPSGVKQGKIPKDVWLEIRESQNMGANYSPCSKKTTFDSDNSKYLCILKNVTVARRVGPLVIMYQGIITDPLGFPSPVFGNRLQPQDPLRWNLKGRLV